MIIKLNIPDDSKLAKQIEALAEVQNTTAEKVVHRTLVDNLLRREFLEPIQCK